MAVFARLRRPSVACHLCHSQSKCRTADIEVLVLITTRVMTHAGTTGTVGVVDAHQQPRWELACGGARNSPYTISAWT